MNSFKCKSLFDMNASIQDAMETQTQMIQGIETMLKANDDGANQTPREVVYTEDKLTLYHYKKQTKGRVSKVPTLIVYALVNTPSMMDINKDRSFIKKLLSDGMDLYLIEWGFPTPDDKYITLEDYIQGYINNCVEHICEAHGLDKINILGVCQGGTFSIMYTALNPDKVKNLITLVTPVDFSTNDGLLFKWGKYLNVNNMVDAYGVIPGDFMNTGFLTLRPLSLMVNKYLNLVDDMDDVESVSNFMTMEKWIFNSPGQAGEAFKQFINDMYHDNKLIKGEVMIGDQKVNLKNIKQPVLNLYAQKDNQVPNAASKDLEKYVSSKDFTSKSFKTGHIGMFVGGRSQKEVAPFISEWANKHSK